eukprot:14904995-Alexandrium_andersonii.AAC.1
MDVRACMSTGMIAQQEKAQEHAQYQQEHAHAHAQHGSACATSVAACRTCTCVWSDGIVANFKQRQP